MLAISYIVNGQRISHDLNDGDYVVGRKKSSTIMIKDPSISGQHVTLQVQAGAVSFQDMGSRNGVFLNGVKVPTGNLVQGDILRIGKLDIAFTIAGAPLDFSAATQTDNPHDEATPADDYAVAPPMPVLVVAPASAAVAVVHVSDSVSGSDNRQKKTLIMIGALAVSFLLLILAIALKPGPEKTTGITGGKEITPQQYSEHTKKAIALFEKKDYAKAHDKFSKVQQFWDKKKDGGNTQVVAGIFADVTKPFMDAEKGKYNQTAWLKLRTQIIDADDAGLIPTVFNGFSRDLDRLVRSESKAKIIFDEANKLLESKRYKDSKQTFQEIPAESIYHKVVVKSVDACDVALVSELHKSAKQLASTENFDEAIRVGHEAEAIKSNDGFKALLASWRVNSEILSDINRGKKLLATNDLKKVENAREVFERMLKVYAESPTVAKLVPDLIDDCDSKKYIIQLRDLYRQADSEGIEKMADDILLAQSKSAKEIFLKNKRIKKAFVEADEFLEAKLYHKARSRWVDITTTIETNANNGFYRRALAKLEEWPRDRVGEELRKQAVEFFRTKKPRLARKILLKVSKDYGIDVSKEVDTIKQAGKKLYNAGINHWHGNRPTQGAEDVWLAKDHFLTSEDFYAKITSSINKNNIPRPKNYK